MEYANYAAHCLKTMATIPDHESRIIHREMAAEWLKLAAQAAGEDAALGARAAGRAKAPTRARS
jgi:hypothetical protein